MAEPDLLADMLGGLLPPSESSSWPPRLALPTAPTTRFAPAPTGDLHLGHLVNALVVWGVAGAMGGRVLLRLEDHDRQRSRPELEAGILDDLDRLGLRPDAPSTDELRSGRSSLRQSDDGRPYEAALERLAADGLVYGCDCTRATFADWERRRGVPWNAPGCPGGCRERRVPLGSAGSIPRIALARTFEEWDDLRLGSHSGPSTGIGGDPPARDRAGNWTYAFSVVVDDLRHGVDLVIRGEDILDATPQQIALGRLLGRVTPARFLHHPLVRTRDGAKLSKSDRSIPIRSLLDGGLSRETLFGAAGWLAGLMPEPEPVDLATIVATFARRAASD